MTRETDASSTPSAPSAPVGDRREVGDPQTLRALTHPVRLALLEVLQLEGPLTATQAGELIGEPPNTCSFHFRQLAKYGFVEPAGPGRGRAHPWRLTGFGMHFSDLSDDPEMTQAARGLDRMLRERYFARLRAFYETRPDYPRKWQQVTGASQTVVHVTPDELAAIDAEIMAVLDRNRDRLADASLRPEGSLPVEVLLFAYPIHPPSR